MRKDFGPPPPNAVLPTADVSRSPRAYLLILWLIAAAHPAALPAQERPPYSLDQVVELVRSGVFSADRIIELTGRSCLAFRVDETAVSRLLAAGANQGLVERLRDVCRRLPVTVMVEPSEIELEVGKQDTLTARALTADSVPILGIGFRWRSDDTTVVVASDSGGVTAVAPGETRVRAITPEGPQGLATVRVMAMPPPDDSLSLPDSLRIAEATGKSVGTAVALGLVIPGGGELYSGNVVKGLTILVGSAAAVTAGALISNEDTVSLVRRPDAGTPDPCNADEATCVWDVTNEAEVEETSYLVVGAAAAGALWLYGLIDGIRAASRTRASGQEIAPGDRELSVRLAPADGIRYGKAGEVEFTLIRLIW